jgi:hypothetical protein
MDVKSFKCAMRSVMLVGKARNLPKKGGSGLTHKHCTRLERPAMENLSSLFGSFVNYKEKSVVYTAPVTDVIKPLMATIYKGL